jgi:hypothetical protein
MDAPPQAYTRDHPTCSNQFAAEFDPGSASLPECCAKSRDCRMIVRVEIDYAIPGRLARPDDADPAQGQEAAASLV